jgi:hypothetical protein
MEKPELHPYSWFVTAGFFGAALASLGSRLIKSTMR